MKKLLLLSLILLSLVMAPLASFAVPMVISYQAQLLEESSKLPMTGATQVTFEIYDAQFGGNQVWSEIQNVNLDADGYLNVYLGSVNPFNASMDWNKQYWLQVTVGKGSPLARTQFSSVPTSGYSQKSGRAAIATAIDDGSVTLASLSDEVRNVTGGDVEGSLPVLKLKPGAVVANIGQGEITQSMLSPNVSTRPSGPAGGSLTGFYPDPVIAEAAINTKMIGDGQITYMKLQPAAGAAGTILSWNGTKWVESTVAAMEVDGVIGNEVLNATINRGLVRAGTGTNLDPYTLGIMDGGVTTAMIADKAVTAAKLAGGISPSLWANGTTLGQIVYWDGTMWKWSDGPAPLNTQILKWTVDPNSGAKMLSWANDAMSIPFKYVGKAEDANGNGQTMFSLTKTDGGGFDRDGIYVEVGKDGNGNIVSNVGSALVAKGSGQIFDSGNLPVAEFSGLSEDAFFEGALHVHADVSSIHNKPSYGAMIDQNITGGDGTHWSAGAQISNSIDNATVGVPHYGVNATSTISISGGNAVGVAGTAMGAGAKNNAGVVGIADNGTNTSAGVVGFANGDAAALANISWLAGSTAGVTAYNAGTTALDFGLTAQGNGKGDAIEASAQDANAVFGANVSSTEPTMLAMQFGTGKAIAGVNTSDVNATVAGDNGGGAPGGAFTNKGRIFPAMWAQNNGTGPSIWAISNMPATDSPIKTLDYSAVIQNLNTGRAAYIEGGKANNDNGGNPFFADPTDKDDAALVVMNKAHGASPWATAIKTYGDIWANSTIGASQLVGLNKIIIGDPLGLHTELTPPASPGAPMVINSSVQIVGDLTVNDIFAHNITANMLTVATLNATAITTQDLTVTNVATINTGNLQNLNVANLTTTKDLNVTNNATINNNTVNVEKINTSLELGANAPVIAYMGGVQGKGNAGDFFVSRGAGLNPQWTTSVPYLKVTNLDVTNNANIGNNINVTNDANITGNTNVGGNLQVTGDAGVDGNLLVLQSGIIGMDLSVLNDELIGNNLTVIGSSDLQGGIMNTTGDVMVNDNLGVTGNTNLMGTLTVAGMSTLNGATTVNNTLNVTGNTTLGANLAVAGNTALAGTLTVTGASTLNGATMINNTLGVTGATTLGSTLTVAGATQINNTLGVTGNTTLGANLAVAGNTALAGTLTVTGVSTLNGATTVNNTLNVTGATTLGSTLTVAGATQINNTLGVTGNTTLGADLAVAGNSALAGTLTVTGASTLNGATMVNNTLGVTGATSLGSTLTVTGASTLNGALTANNTAQFNGTSVKLSATTELGAWTGLAGQPGNAGDLLVSRGAGLSPQWTNTIPLLNVTDLNVIHNATVGNQLDVVGTVNLNTNGTSTTHMYNLDVNHDGVVGNDFLVGNNLTSGANLLVGGTAQVIGAATFMSTIDARGAISNTTGDVNVNDNLNVTGNETVGGTFAVTGASTLNGATTVNNTLNVTGATTLGGTLQVAGLATFNNNVNINQNLFVNQNATVNQNLTVNQQTTLNNTTTQTLGNFFFNTAAGTMKLGDVASIFDVWGTIQNTNAGFPVKVQDDLLVTGGLTVNGAIVFNGPVTINNTLHVTGNTTLDADLSVGGNTSLTGTLAVGGASTLNGATTINNTLNVTGATTLGSTLAVAGNTTVGGTLGVTGNTTLGADLAVTGNSTLTGSLTVGGPSTLNGATMVNNTLGVTGNTTLGADLAVAGNSTLTGTLTVGGASTLNGATMINNTLGVTGNTTLGADLAVTGNSTLTGTLTVGGASTLNGATMVNNTLGVTGNTTLGADLSVAGNSTLTGNATVGGTLGVTGNTTLGADLSVAGNSTLTGNETVGGTLGVTGATTLANTLAVTGATTLNSTLHTVGNTTLDADLAVGGNTTLTGNETIGGTLGVTGATQLNSTLGVTGAATFTSTIDAQNAISNSTANNGGNVYVNDGFLVNGTIQSGMAGGVNGKLSLFETTTNFSVSLQANAAMAGNVTYTLPVADGTANQMLMTDGAGNLSWNTATLQSVYNGSPAGNRTITTAGVGEEVQIQNANNDGYLLHLSSSTNGVNNVPANNDLLLLEANGVGTQGSALRATSQRTVPTIQASNTYAAASATRTDGGSAAFDVSDAGNVSTATAVVVTNNSANGTADGLYVRAAGGNAVEVRSDGDDAIRARTTVANKAAIYIPADNSGYAIREEGNSGGTILSSIQTVNNADVNNDRNTVLVYTGAGGAIDPLVAVTSLVAGRVYIVVNNGAAAITGGVFATHNIAIGNASMVVYDGTGWKIIQ